jgi:hypothetical protein
MVMASGSMAAFCGRPDRSAFLELLLYSASGHREQVGRLPAAAWRVFAGLFIHMEGEGLMLKDGCGYPMRQGLMGTGMYLIEGRPGKSAGGSQLKSLRPTGWRPNAPESKKSARQR